MCIETKWSCPTKIWRKKEFLVLKLVAMATKQAFRTGDIPRIVRHMLLMFIRMFYGKMVKFDKDVHRKKIFNEEFRIVAMVTFFFYFPVKHLFGYSIWSCSYSSLPHVRQKKILAIKCSMFLASISISLRLLLNWIIKSVAMVT